MIDSIVQSSTILTPALQNTMIVLIVIVVVYIGKYMFTSKEDEKKIEKDINAISNKLDCMVSGIRQDFTGALHNLELKTSDKFLDQSIKHFDKIDEMWEKIDLKYVSKEMNRQHEDRIKHLEDVIEKITPRLEKIDIIFDMMQEKKTKNNNGNK